MSNKNVKFVFDRFGDGQRNLLGLSEKGIYSYVDALAAQLATDIIFKDGEIAIKRGTVITIPSRLVKKCIPQ